MCQSLIKMLWGFLGHQSNLSALIGVQVTLVSEIQTWGSKIQNRVLSSLLENTSFPLVYGCISLYQPLIMTSAQLLSVSLVCHLWIYHGGIIILSRWVQNLPHPVFVTYFFTPSTKKSYWAFTKYIHITNHYWVSIIISTLLVPQPPIDCIVVSPLWKS